MDYNQSQGYRQKNVLTERNFPHDSNKENIININYNNNDYQTNNKNRKMKEISMEEYESLLHQLSKLKQDINLTNKVKSELLQVSKKETEEYANNVMDYTKQFEIMNQEIESLQNELNNYKSKNQQ